MEGIYPRKLNMTTDQQFISIKVSLKDPLPPAQTSASRYPLCLSRALSLQGLHPSSDVHPWSFPWGFPCPFLLPPPPPLTPSVNPQLSCPTLIQSSFFPLHIQSDRKQIKQTYKQISNQLCFSCFVPQPASSPAPCHACPVRRTCHLTHASSLGAMLAYFSICS